MTLNDDVKLTSWTSWSDPRAGSYTFQQDQAGFTILNGSSIHWKSGAVGSTAALIDGKLLLPVSQLLQDSINPASQPSTKGNKSTVNYKNFTDQRIESRLVMSYTGEIQYFHSVRDTVPSWSEPKNRCSIYGICGNSAVCNAKTDPICQCPEGFKPASSEDWKAGQYSAGCDREFAECNNKDSFKILSLIEVPDEVVEFELAKDEEACKGECLSRCKCKAYSFVVVNGGARSRAGSNSTGKCLVWTNELVNLHHDDYGGVLNIFLRRPREDVGMVKQGGDQPKAPQNRSKKTYVIAGVVGGGIVLIAFFSCLLYRKIRRPHGYGNQEGSSNTRDAPILFSNQSERRVNELMQERGKLIDVPFYNLDTILSATDNFSDSNKLGQGGFGPVYKGRFPGGHEFAVKRLSSLSGQGIEEFINEVVLIAKLQHRNLVRLVGYCIKENEKMLLYEYMPNRSLDAFIFDQHKCLLLDWKKRFDIILGIARGLLYLHQDSRLRIIHRDLKTSNILLDEDMNPKISDFGLARIVEGKGMEASTNRVVGTYGYMSPEYALDGKFSTKSDVFSFGVVMLEIVSGKKTNGFYNPHQVLNLLGYTWRLWSEQKALDLVDPTMVESCEQSQVMKCINVGLLCVQEDPNERPSMSSVVVMLGSETTSLPAPTQPAFVVRRRLSTTSSSSSTKPDMISKNDLTISMAQGR